MSVSIKVGLGFNLEFNNTELKWNELQHGFKVVLEKEYVSLHCINEKYHDEYEIGMNIVKFIKNNKEIIVEMYCKIQALSTKFICLTGFRTEEHYTSEGKIIHTVILKDD